MAGSKKILIIEDDKFIAEMYAKLLVGHGYKVDFAVNGKEGLQKAKGGDYDLILLDIMMPEVTGIDVLKQLRGDDGIGLANTKIVILTNLGQNQASQDA
ncbi:MAG TPA: response regulator, partial [Candidatus Nanoarchaeia archaeon]|nr:response regulator [Candidatus Nanoarchaeia archaeon]